MKRTIILIVNIILFISNMIAQENSNLTNPVNTETMNTVAGTQYYPHHDIIPKEIIELDLDWYRVPTRHSVDHTKSIGEIPIQQSMVNGALTYNVPIEVYPGSNNMQPNISLSYNSFAKEGIAGCGWNIGGLSSINLVNHNQYFDGYTDESKMDKTGAYALDGNRLINLNTGTENEIKYQTEQGFILVSAYLNSNSIKYFQVKYPNGSKAVYGHETNASNELSYPITRIEDKLGNYVEYKYEKASNVYYVSEISYGSKKNLIGSVKFSYLNRSSMPTLYIHGTSVVYEKYLKSIETYCSTQKLRTFILSFDNNSNVLLLDKINCLNDKNEELNPLIFYYCAGATGDVTFRQSESHLASFQMQSHHNIEKVPMFKGQFSPLKTGFFIFPAEGSPYGLYPFPVPNRGSRPAFGSTVRSEEQSRYKMQIYYDALEPEKVGLLEIGYGFIDAISADVNGDGIDEIIRINTDNCASGPKEIVSYNTYTITSGKAVHTSNFNVSYTEYSSEPYYIENDNKVSGYIKSPIKRRHISGNFLGDGKHQVLSISENKDHKGNSRSSLMHMLCFNSKDAIFGKSFDLSPNDVLFVIDYDGDGKADLAKISGKYLCIYTFSRLPTGEIAYSMVVSNYDLSSSNTNDIKLTAKDFVVGDLNGDGKTDFLVRPLSGGSTWHAYYSTNASNKFVKKTINICNYTTNMQFYLQDIDRDGVMDLIKLTNNTVFSCFMGVKDGSISNKENQILSLTQAAKFIPNNIFQNNQLHLMLGVKSNKLVSIISEHDNSQRHLLLGSINSFGVIKKHAYSIMNNPKTEIYEVGKSDYPHTQIGGDIYLLKKDETYFNSHTSSSIQYKYKGGTIDITKKGGICFEKIYITDNLHDQTSIQTYDPYFMGALRSSESPYNITTLDYKKSFQPNKIAVISLLRQTEKDKLKGATITTSYIYDAYNNPLTQTTIYGADHKTTQTNSYFYHNTEAFYKTNELASKIVKEENSLGSITTKQVLSYNDSRQISSIKNYYNNNIRSEETFIYNSFNELSEAKSKKYSSPNWISKKYTYDDFGRPKRETDALNNYVDYVYNIYGQLSSKKDYKMNEVKYEYDNWGKIIKTASSDGITEVNEYKWASSRYSSGTIYYITTTTSQSQLPSSYTYYDIFGRITRKGELKVNNKKSYILYTDNVYNNKGQLERTSLPYTRAASSWINYTYDSYGRIELITNPSGKKEHYSYSFGHDGYTINNTINDIAISKTYNSKGQLKFVSGIEGKTSYNYNADGQLSTIKIEPELSKSILTFFSYDSLGRQIEVNDPSSGKKQILYDNAGNISQETEANGNTIVNTYDTLGRITKKVATSVNNNEIYTTNYSYNTDGLLISEVGSNSNLMTINYVYNNNFTLKSVKETTTDGKWLEKTYTYDNKGMPISIVYKSNSGNIGTETFSYLHGHVVEKSFNNISYWKLEDENILGIPIKVSTGTITREYEYDNYGILKARKASVDSINRQSIKYEFSLSNGNLISRTDERNNNITETFQYDKLNRLITYNDIGIKYDSKGNITQKDDVGTYYYNESSPYAISNLNVKDETVHIQAQQVSYNGLMRPRSVAGNGYAATFDYDGNGERVKMILKKNNSVQLTRYYVGSQYEVELGLAGAKELLYLGGDAYNASSVYVKENNKWTIYHICRDYLGSITHVLDANGSIRQELSYDAWGRLRNPANHQVYSSNNEPMLFLGRGYTGHEHLPWLGLINMNSRLYDPLLGRFLSPDPDIKNPDFLQNYNRYSYALNNPLKYVDPDGENPFIVFGLGFLFGYAANGLHTGDWGWSSIGSGLFVGSGMGLTYAHTGGGNPWLYSGQFAANEICSNFIRPYTKDFGDFSLSIYPYSMFTNGIANRAGNGYALGAGISLSYNDGKSAFSLNGIGSFRNSLNNFEGKFSAGGGYNGYQYFLNYYTGRDAQFTGTISVQRGKFSLRWENDVLAMSGDKFRSNATEIGWGDYIIGTNVYTTDPGGYDKKDKTWDFNGSNIFPNGKNGTYKNGHQISSPFYIGHKTKYGIRRVGINSPGIGDLIQNGFHHIKLPFILWGFPAMSSGHFQRGNYESFYHQSGTYIPGIMY